MWVSGGGEQFILWIIFCIFKNRWFLSLGFILNQFWDIWEFLDPWREVSLERPPLGSSVHCWDWNVNQERDSESGDRRNTTWKQSQPGASGVLLPDTDHLLRKIKGFKNSSWNVRRVLAWDWFVILMNVYQSDLRNPKVCVEMSLTVKNSSSES